jgi:hypothetical protein
MAAAAIRRGRRVRAQGHPGPESRGSVVGYCRVLVTQRAVATSRCHALDDRPRAARLYELLGPYADRNVLVARLPLGTLGSAPHYLGLLAAATGRRDDAAAHFQDAARAHERMGAEPLLERSRRALQRL